MLCVILCACIFGKLVDVYNSTESQPTASSGEKKQRKVVAVLQTRRRNVSAQIGRGGGWEGRVASERPNIHLISPSVCLTQSALTAGSPSPFISRIPSSYPFIIYLFIYVSAVLREAVSFVTAALRQAASVNRPKSE